MTDDEFFFLVMTQNIKQILAGAKEGYQLQCNSWLYYYVFFIENIMASRVTLSSQSHYKVEKSKTSIPDLNLNFLEGKQDCSRLVAKESHHPVCNNTICEGKKHISL